VILVDTSIWIDHFKGILQEHLDYLLAGESVIMHDFVIGEIVMGALRERGERIAFLQSLHRIATAKDTEVRMFVESVALHGTGLSYIDAHLLTAARASADAEPVRIWTRDKRLHAHAEHLGIAYSP
jgi:predicted nucleic acid-binding protein